MKKYLFSLMAFAVALTAAIFFDNNVDASFVIGASAIMPFAMVGVDRERAAYEFFATKFPMFGIQKSVVRLEKTCTTQTQLKYDPRQVSLDIESFPLSKGTDDNDVDIVLRGGLFIDIRPTANPQLPVLQSYPNPVAFSDLATPSNAEAFYNATLTYSVGQTLVNNGVDTQLFRKVPTTQQTLATNFSEFSINENCIDLSPFFVISGKADNSFVLNLTTPSGWTVDPTTGANGFFVTLYFQTLKLKNAANVFYELLYLATGQKLKNDLNQMTDLEIIQKIQNARG